MSFQKIQIYYIILFDLILQLSEQKTTSNFGGGKRRLRQAGRQASRQASLALSRLAVQRGVAVSKLMNDLNRLVSDLILFHRPRMA
jgi:hypothetical protein